MAYQLLLYHLYLKSRRQERSSSLGYSSMYSHFQKTAQLAQVREMADIHDVSIANNTARNTRGKVDCHLHMNVCKVGVVHTKNVLWMYLWSTCKA